MKRHFFGAVGSLTALLLVAGCASDPTADLRGSVATVVISRTYVELSVGETVRLNAKAYDQQGNVLGTLPTITVSDESIATITIDTVTTGDPMPETDFVVTAVGAGQVTVTATADGVTGTTDLIAFPTTFAGSVSVAASGLGWDVITVNATANVKFDPAATTATIDGLTAFIHSITADQLVLVHSGADAVTGGTVHLNNLVFLDEFGANLDAVTTVDVAAFQNGLFTVGAPPGAATDITAGPFPLKIYGLVTGDDYDVFALLAPAADLALTSSVVWIDGDVDIDVFYADDAGDIIDCLGCGGSNPETGNWVITGGDTQYYWVELYDGPDAVFQATLTLTPAPAAKR
ncbi:MAG: hypothetical protein IH616_14655 [Gemmatimonadales bacterium]|jgi:hypothetical protein|nr:hypothetical protein [Gemmatimonadales bacterium]